MANITGGSIVWDLNVAGEKLSQGLATARKEVESTAKDVGKRFKDLSSNMSDIGKQMSLSLTAPITAVGAVGFSLVKMGGQYSSVADSFRSMTQDMGVDVKQFEKAVSDATGGQIDNLTILQSATKGLSLIGKEAFNNFGSDFVKMAELSKKASRATGQDVDFMFESLVTGIARESQLILDNLGLSIDITKAKSNYAKQLGKTSSELTISEGKHAVLNEALTQLESIYGDVAISAGGFSGAWQQLTTILTNARIEIGQELEPTLSELVKNLSAIAKDIIPVVVSVVRSLLDGFNSLSPEMQKIIVVSIALVAAFGPILIILSPLVAGIGALITVVSSVPLAVGLVAKAFMGLAPVFTFLLAHPLILIFAGIIAGLVLLATAWRNNWGDIQGKTKAAFDFIKNLVTGFIASTQNTWNSLLSFFNNMASRITDAIIKPFRDAKAGVERAAQEIKNMANKINPFHRESPSLVDNVRNGVRAIIDEYDKLNTQISISRPGFETPQVSSGNSGNYNVYIDKVNDMQDAQMIARELGFRAGFEVGMGTI